MPINMFTTLDDPLGVFNGSGANGTAASGINNAGQIVGYYYDANRDGHMARLRVGEGADRACCPVDDHAS
jgi:uncharacterized membrane protein